MKKIHLAFLWHFHQPYYRESVEGDFMMAWVRLHGVKDYIGMGNHLLEFPKMKSTFNFTPSLIAQIFDYIEGKAEDKIQKICKKDVSDLSHDEKCYILDKFFQANWNNMIRIWPRYEQLYRKRRINVKSAAEVLKNYTNQDLLDLEVWFNLTWIHQTEVEKDRFLIELRNKGKDFTKPELDTLMQKHIEILSKIIPLYKELKERGQVELTTTPYYHPILPLLFNMESALKAMPNNKLPKRIGELEEDGIIQIKRGIDLFKKYFGFSPQGVWPSEGSVSTDIIPHLLENGINWIATDEEILGHSLKRDIKDLRKRNKLLYIPYKAKGNNEEITMVFRDHALSDLIGFKYQGWDSELAADDLVNKVLDIAQHSSDNSIVNIILDGENAWEYYPNNAIPFLLNLYKKITENEFIISTTVSEYLDKFPAERTIDNLFPGSWIDHNFYIWVGHHEDVKAWEYLYKTREILKSYTLSGKANIDRKNLAEAWEELYIAEGSDWFWWFGDDHNSGEDDVYDYLFREHLKNVFRKLGMPTPDFLNLPVISPEKEEIFKAPKEFLKIKLDGKNSSYFEWICSGKYNTKSEKVAMDFDIEKIVKEIYFGFDIKNFYLRIDTFNNADSLLGKERKILIQFISPKNINIEISKNKKGEITAEVNGNTFNTVSIYDILELGISFEDLGFTEREVVEFYIEIIEDGNIIERTPIGSLLLFEVPDEEFEVKYWDV
ncbi:alpha-amylase/alpha-mannosidase [candidate division KSB1 bacterium]